MARQTIGERRATEWQRERVSTNFVDVLPVLPRPPEVFEALAVAVEHGLQTTLLLDGSVRVHGEALLRTPRRAPLGHFTEPVIDALAAADFAIVPNTKRTSWLWQSTTRPTAASVYEMLRARNPPDEWLSRSRKGDLYYILTPPMVDAAWQMHAKCMVKYDDYLRESGRPHGIADPLANIRTSVTAEVTHRTDRPMEQVDLLTIGWDFDGKTPSYYQSRAVYYDANLMCSVLEPNETTGYVGWHPWDAVHIDSNGRMTGF